MKSIMICTPGRSGSHWLLYMLHRITGLQMRPQTVNPPPLEGYVWGTRERLDDLPELAGKLDVLFLLRDPRDVEVSMRQYHDPAVFKREADAIVRDLGWFKWFLRLRLEGTWLVRYENMLTDPVHLMQDLMVQMGRTADPATIRKAVEIETARAPSRELSGRYRQYWSKRKLDGFMGRFGEEMRRLGY